MGTIRFLLALSVFFAHLKISGHGLILNNGSEAVQLFFIISGFYMFLTYENKYIKLNEKSRYYFYTNRFLRIYPTYLIILIATIGYSLYSSKFSPNIPNKFAVYVAFKDQLNSFSFYGLGINNFTLLGMETLNFFTIYESGLIGKWNPTQNFGADVLSQFQFVPQAWSLGMEFWFYLLCPFLVNLKNKTLLASILVLLIFKILFISMVSNEYHWEYRFLPFELILFLLGAYTYHIHKNYLFKNIQINKFIFALSVFVVLFLEAFSDYFFLKWGIFFCFAFAIPRVFDLSRKNRLDKVLGDLSFPIYISHILVIMISNEFVFEEEYIRIGFIVVSVLLLSLLLNKLTSPIEKFRSKRIIH